MELTFDKALTALSEVSRVDGSLKALTMNGQKLTIQLAAGDAMFIALPEGYDYYKPVTGQPAATVNLVDNAMITAPTSVGSDGWYISCLQDGARLSTGNGNGWRTSDRKASYVDIDLGETLSFNRVDLYAAGNIFDYGKTFPAELKISVSNDGKTFTEVKSLTDLTVTQPKGMQVDIGAQTARYIRIDLLAITKGAQYMSIGEIEVYNDDGSVPAPESFSLLDENAPVISYTEGENIAKGKETFYSSTTPAHYQVWGWDISFINDGKTGNGWTSNVGLNRSPNSTEYVGINFGDLFAVEKIVLEDNGSFPEDYTVSLSEDGLNWVVVSDVKGSKDYDSGYKVEIVLETPVNARFIRVMGTKLRGGGNDGYLLQLGEIEAYGKPVCDKTVLEEAIATYEAEGGDKTAKEYKEADRALSNKNLTQTQAVDFAKKLLALIGKEIETTPPETDPVDPDTGETTEPTEVPTDDETAAPTEPSDTTEAPADTTAEQTTEAPTEPTKGGCGSVIGLSVLLTLSGAALMLRKKKED